MRQLGCPATVAEAAAVVRPIAEGLVIGLTAAAQVSIPVHCELVTIRIRHDEFAARPIRPAVRRNYLYVCHNVMPS